MPAKFSGDTLAKTKLEVVQGPRNWCGIINRHYIVAVVVGRKYAGKVIILESMQRWFKFSFFFLFACSSCELRVLERPLVYWVALTPSLCLPY